MADQDSGVARQKRMEKNNQPQGRSGNGVPQKKPRGGNPTSGGGINERTRGKRR